MNTTKRNSMFYALILTASFLLSPVAYAGTDGAGLVLFTAIQRSKVKQPSKLTFACETGRGKHELYAFDFYAHSPHSPFGTAKIDEKGLTCDPITLQTFITRHSTSCLDRQVHWAHEQIQKTLSALPKDGPYRVKMSVHSQIGDTHWSNDWGSYLVGLFSFVSESHANEVECDLKISLELHERTEDHSFIVLDKISYSFNSPTSLTAPEQDQD